MASEVFTHTYTLVATHGPSYLAHVAWNYLIPHAAGTLALYAYSYRDYVRERAVESTLAMTHGAGDADARVRVWKELKHEHAFPLHREDGGVAAGYKRILPQVLWVDWCVAPMLALLWGWVSLILPGLFDMWDSENPLRSIAFMTARMIASAALYEVVLVGAHVIMHLPALYPMLHKTHHMGPQCALAGTYMTGWEAAINGTGLSFAIVGILGMPMPVTLLTAVMGRINLGRVHSGWRAVDKTTPEAAFHGVHHLGMRDRASNYGFAEWLDRLLGTHVDPRTVFPESFSAPADASPKAAEASKKHKKAA